MKNALRFVVLALGAAVVAGCPGEKGPQLVPVEGNVTINGEPADRLRVEFWPEQTGPNSAATTDANGHFVLEVQDGSGAKGAVVGMHKILVRDMATMTKFLGRAGEDTPSDNPPRISTIYSNHVSSGLTQSISGPTTDVKIDLKPYDPAEAQRMAEEQAKSTGAPPSSSPSRDR